MRSASVIAIAACACGTAMAFVPAPMSRVSAASATQMQQQKKPQQEAMDLNLEDMFEGTLDKSASYLLLHNRIYVKFTPQLRCAHKCAQWLALACCHYI
jgi:hypothetical protein